ncbi:MAG: choice-of-anchor J domain-containing protein [Crocinitomicaceae bacterium]|nr:choice-of-anchor J domain-containing protein [Crocinitomicaceae bacterium]
MKNLFTFLGVICISFMGKSQVYFQENFNGGSLTADNAWNVYDVAPSASNQTWFYHTFSGNSFAQVTNFTNNTNEALETWLISPSIALVNSQNPVLSFDNTKRFAGDDIQLLISTDYDGTSNPTNGFSWSNITNLANFDTDISVWTLISSGEIDLSTYNNETIYVAFQYVGSTTDGSTYRIDNILLEEDGTTVGGCATGLFCDDFEGANLTANNPWTTFTVVPSSGNLNWTQGSFSGNKFASMGNFVSGNNQEVETWLITPAIDFSSVTNVIFSFDHTKRFAGDNLEILVSTDYDGTSNPTNSFTWDNITNLANMDQDISVWTLVSSGNINLSNYSGNNAVYIAYKYVGSNTDGSTYRIDNVFVGENIPSGITSIFDIQFTTDPSGDSPLKDENVTTTGIVTATGSSFYFIQDGVGPWTGIEVFNSTNQPSVGDSVVVAGRVVEFNGVTQIANVTSFEVIASNLDLPLPSLLNTGSVAQEQWEGVFIRVEDAICTNDNLGFSMWQVNDGSGALRVDDKMHVYQAILGQRYEVIGVVNFAFGNFRLSPRFASDIKVQLSLSESALNSTKVYPNPANSLVHIEGMNLQSLTVIDALGKLRPIEVKSSDFNGFTFDVSDWQKGVYFLSDQSGRTEKLVVY